MKRIDYFSMVYQNERGTFADLGESLPEYIIRQHLNHVTALHEVGLPHEPDIHKWALAEVDVSLSITVVFAQLRRLRPH